MSFSKVPAFTFVSISVAMLCGILIPVLLMCFLRKKTGCKKFPFFVGCGIFLVFAIILESIAHALILGNGRGEALMAKPLLYSLYGGLMAGLFEESGRLLAFKVILKKYKDDNSTALVYGAGHGGFEAFYILFVSMITNLVFAIIINSGNTDLLMKGLEGDGLAKMSATLTQLSSTNPWMFLVSVIERLAAVALHIVLSVLVWFAAKNSKKWFLFPLAIILHLMLDAIAGICSLYGVPVFLIEIIIYVFVILCILLARYILKKEA